MNPNAINLVHTPLVSIVIICFNYGKFVRDALTSVQLQTYPNKEIIIVEGGSTDGQTPDIVKSIEREGVRCLYREKPYLAGNNRNFGLAHAAGEFVCCLDADDMLEPTYITEAVSKLQRENLDIVSSWLSMFGEEHGVFTVPPVVTLDMLLEINCILTSAVYRRRLWEMSGGYCDIDPKIEGQIHEDWIFWVRLAALGAKIANIQAPMLKHRRRSTSLSRQPALMVAQQRMVRDMNRDVLEKLGLYTA